MNVFERFRKQFREICEKVVEIAKSKGAKVHCPQLKKKIVADDSGGWSIVFDTPTLIWDAPSKGSSTRPSQKKKRAIFIDGSFTFAADDKFVRAAASLAIYSTDHQEANRCKLTLVESLHFDFELGTQSSFHPMFHVQRGRNNSLSEVVVQDLVHKVTHKAREFIDVDGDSQNIGYDYVRIPTPPMDYFAVLTMTLADFFCSENQVREDARKAFCLLLKVLTVKENLVWHGCQVETLMARWSDERPFSMGHWYVESLETTNRGKMR